MFLDVAAAVAFSEVFQTNEAPLGSQSLAPLALRNVELLCQHLGVPRSLSASVSLFPDSEPEIPTLP